MADRLKKTPDEIRDGVSLADFEMFIAFVALEKDLP